MLFGRGCTLCYSARQRGGEEVSRGAHNPEPSVQFRPPQQAKRKYLHRMQVFSFMLLRRERANCFARVRNCKAEPCLSEAKTGEPGQEPPARIGASLASEQL